MHGAGANVARAGLSHDRQTRNHRRDPLQQARRLLALGRTGGRTRASARVTESPRKVLNELDGVLLTGGGDVDPVFYGEDRHPLTDDAEPGRDEFEIDLARRAMSENVPLLAICRGAQVLNVAAGGTLVQDIPSAVESELSHSVKEPKISSARDRRRLRLEAVGRWEIAWTARAAAASTAGITSRSADLGMAWSSTPARQMA